MGLNDIMTSEIQFGFPEVKDLSAHIIKVIGVGGGGGNAVKNMLQQGIQNVSFAVVNTDSQALSKTEVPCRLQIGKNGLGVGGRPELGREAAESSIEDINRLFDEHTKMVFITAGMGGGTGTGAAPVIANAAREKDILTIGVVTLPFAFEKRPRIEKALQGVEALKASVDALLVINNERLIEIYADGMTTIEDAFAKADEIITVATRSIAEIITQEGKVNRDFCDVQTVMKNGGGALMSEGRASGEHRIMKAMADALNSPLLNNVDIERSQRLLYIIYQSHKNPVLITELNEVNLFMDNMANDLEVLWGLYWDDTLEDDVKVNIIATGFDKSRDDESQRRQDEDKSEKIKRLFDFYYCSSRKEETSVEHVDENVDESTETETTPDDTSDPQTTDSDPQESEPIETITHKSSWIQTLISFAKKLIEEDA